MKKSLFLLPLVGGFLLSACTFTIFGKEIKLFEKEDSPSTKPSGGGGGGGSGGGGGGGGGGGSDAFVFPTAGADVFIQIDKTDIASYIGANKTYPTEAFTFETDGVSFNATVGVGVKTSERDHADANYYFESDSMQFKKDTGVVSTAAAVSGATKITVNWFATFSSEESMYWPKVKTGSAADSIATTVEANENAPLSGTKTGGKQYMNNASRDAYFYQTTYNISGSQFFSIGDSGGATYIKSIWVHH